MIALPRTDRAVVLAAGLLIVTASPAPVLVAAGAQRATSTVLFRLTDPRLDEVSGIAVSSTMPDVFYVLNDSGDSARFFALSARTGRVLAQYAVPAATNVDWEDIAVAPDARGTPSVWLADIGDNDARRSNVSIYRVDEPRQATGIRDTARPQVWRLRYPSGSVDAESLAVSPSGAPYVITKSPLGISQVYAAPRTPGAATLHAVATVQFRLTGTPGPFAPLGQLTATGASFAADGRLLAIRTYTDAYVWPVRDEDVRAALRARPIRVALPRQPQGEGICIDGRHLIVDSEGRGTAVYAVGIPALPSQSGASAATSSAAETRPAAAANTPTPRLSTPESSGRIGIWIGSIVVLAALLVGVVLRIRRRKPSGRAGSSPWTR